MTTINNTENEQEREKEKKTMNDEEEIAHTQHTNKRHTNGGKRTINCLMKKERIAVRLAF